MARRANPFSSSCCSAFSSILAPTHDPIGVKDRWIRSNPYPDHPKRRANKLDRNDFHLPPSPTQSSITPILSLSLDLPFFPLNLSLRKLRSYLASRVIRSRGTLILLPKQTGHPMVRRDALVDFLNNLGTLDCFL